MSEGEDSKQHEFRLNSKFDQLVEIPWLPSGLGLCDCSNLFGCWKISCSSISLYAAVLAALVFFLSFEINQQTFFSAFLPSSLATSVSWEGKQLPLSSFRGSKGDFNSYNSSNGDDKRFSSSFQAPDMSHAWEIMYNLDSESPPNESISPLIHGQLYPFAPHLQDCAALTKGRKLLEQTNKSFPVPQWAIPSPEKKDVYPPWVRGADEDNLPLTRFIQTQIWRNQFPRDCFSSDVKFAVVEWPTMENHGLGSQLHVFSHLLATAMTLGRTAVPLLSGFERAEEYMCAGESKHSLDCFFFPVVSKECEKRALSMWNGTESDSIAYIEIKNLTNDCNQIPPSATWKQWLSTKMTFELLGEMVGSSQFSETLMRKNYWHSQMLRFVLRWPTALLCHHLNRARHEAYGETVAALMAEAEQDRWTVLQHLAASGGREAAAIALAEARLMQTSAATLEGSVWRREEPYIPRPIVSVHVRQGDKQSEMKLFSFQSHMWMAERLRRHVPNVEHVWLSTEMEEVVEASQNYGRWTFYYTNNTRQRGGTRMIDYTKQVGVARLTVLSFVNLIIASECDHFVGTLGSNWPRLINELRLTNGRFKNGYLALNFEEM